MSLCVMQRKRVFAQVRFRLFRLQGHLSGRKPADEGGAAQNHGHPLGQAMFGNEQSRVLLPMEINIAKGSAGQAFIVMAS